MIDEPLYILALLGASVAIAEVLARRTPLRHAGTALVVILVTAVLANVGLLPTATGEVPVYSAIFKDVAWIALFFLLLRVHLRSVLRAGSSMIALFLIGALGTMAGALIALWIVGGERLGAQATILAGMYTGTYTGGSANFVAIASQYQVTDGTLLAVANTVDAAMTTLWMAVTLILPRFFGRKTAAPSASQTGAALKLAAEIEDDTETVHPIDVGLLLFAGASAVWFSERAASWAEAKLGVSVPGILILTTLALVLAQLPAVGRLRGARLLGMFGVYLFLAVIGALCDLRALVHSGALGLALLAFVTVVFLVHGVVTFGATALFRLDPAIAAVASQANIGGGTTALALARSLGRSDLVLPGILVGSVGTALGTYLGVAVIALLS